jgi:nicotinamidase-related amidase
VNLQPVQDVIKQVRKLLDAWRKYELPVYHTREGHRPDLSTLSSRELARSKDNPSGLGIGDKGPLGRLLVRGEPGHDIVKELQPRENEAIIDKPGRSAFAHTDFELLLRIKGIKNLVICGVTTDVCVSSTMREANDRAFDCVLVEDCSVASEETLRVGALDSIRAEGGIFGATAKLEDVLRVLPDIRD